MWQNFIYFSVVRLLLQFKIFQSNYNHYMKIQFLKLKAKIVPGWIGQNTNKFQIKFHWIHRKHPRWLSGKESTCQCGRYSVDPQVRKISWRRKWQPSLAFLPEKSHRSSLVAYNPSVQFSSVTQSCLTLCNSMYCNMPGLPVHHQLLEIAQTHVHRVGDAI